MLLPSIGQGNLGQASELVHLFLMVTLDDAQASELLQDVSHEQIQLSLAQDNAKGARQSKVHALEWPKGTFGLSFFAAAVSFLSVAPSSFNVSSKSSTALL
jgi:hypothetical protein